MQKTALVKKTFSCYNDISKYLLIRFKSSGLKAVKGKNNMNYGHFNEKNGNTAALINLLTENLTGVYMITNAFESNISPCIDCGYCRKNGVCAVNDDMSGVYEYIKDCDNIVIASPIYFSELTGPLLSLCSRFQAFYCSRRYLNTEPIDTGKKGGIILVGGGDGSFDTAEKTAGILLRQMGADTFFPPIVSHNTDIIPASEDQSAADDILKLADFFIAPTISCDKSNRRF